MWGWIAWGIVILTVWVAIAALVGVLLGRAVRRRDRQVPSTPVDVPPPARAPAEERQVPERRPRT